MHLPAWWPAGPQSSVTFFASAAELFPCRWDRSSSSGTEPGTGFDKVRTHLVEDQADPVIPGVCDVDVLRTTYFKQVNYLHVTSHARSSTSQDLV